MERRTRSGKHQVTVDRVNVKTFANTNVPQKNPKEPKKNSYFYSKTRRQRQKLKQGTRNSEIVEQDCSQENL